MLAAAAVECLCKQTNNTRALMSKYAPHPRTSQPRATASTVCQKCLKTGHFIYDCKSARAYVSRPSRTQQLENPSLLAKLTKASVEVPEELKQKDGTATRILEAREREREQAAARAGKGKKRETKKAKRSSSDSDSDPDSDSDSDSSSSTSRSGSGSNSSTDSERSRERDRTRRVPATRHSQKSRSRSRSRSP